ncbi:hypothetical protein D3C86_1535890 [compost metagenome]
MGATLTVRAVIVQTGSAERAEQHRLKVAADLDQRNCERDLLAARSVMPLSLTILNRYSGAVAVAADQVLSSTRATRIRRRADQMPSLPDVPDAILGDLQNFIRVASPEIASNVADLLSDLQLLAARADGVWSRTVKGGGEIVMRDNYIDLVARAAILHARTSALFSYARREAKDPETVSSELADNALRLWFGPLLGVPAYSEVAAHLAKKATSPAP